MTQSEVPGPSLEDLYQAHAEDRYRTAAKLLLTGGVIPTDAIDTERMRAAIERDAAEELTRDNASEPVDTEILAGVEYITSRARLEKALDDIRMRKTVSLPSNLVGFEAVAKKEFEDDPTIISMLLVQNTKSGLLGTTLIEQLAPDGSRVVRVRRLSDYSASNPDSWTRSDYEVGTTEGKVHEQLHYKNTDGRFTSAPPTDRDLTGEDVSKLATRLAADYRPVQGGLLHRELPPASPATSDARS